ncbi:hypothetical protein [Paracoccus lutimaris]|uniref:hypothetical protein n=1 Tax=Paracoccus lutimaris TaxID=1490030 RepID=UPI0011C0624E|nr:hypothetical protein [Paracoccus lutimaris]
MHGFPSGSIWSADDEISIQIREVYSRYGLAMYHAQVLEHGMANAAIVLHMLPTASQYPNRIEWVEALDSAFNSELSKTFGNMLKALSSSELPKTIIDGLGRAKVVRDHLAHRFFREHDQNFFGISGREKMISEC